MTFVKGTEETLDLAIIGFGPASLSLMVALHDHSEKPLRNKKVCVLEKSPLFSWHSGMLIPGSNMQISFVKDLATPRDPTSYFSFLNYLHQNGDERFSSFLNLSTLEPSRYEFHDYLCWAAGHFKDYVQYGANVTKLEYDQSLDLYRITYGDHQKIAKNVIVATGGQANIPKPFSSLQSPQVIHSSGFMFDDSQRKLRSAKHGVLVIGSGQSAAEIWNHSHNIIDSKLPLTLAFRNLSLIPSDSSPFVNSLYFDSHNSHWWYNLPEQTRIQGLRNGHTTNYGVVKEELLEDMYREQYMQKLKYGKACHNFLNATYVDSVEQKQDHILVTLASKLDGIEKKITQKFDVIYLATGYNHASYETILSPIFPHSHDIRIAENYLVENTPSKNSRLFVIGISTYQHGIGETLLSWTAIRAGELASQIFGPSKPTARPFSP
ncbi:ornithine N5 monooxygenase [Schizosaccharomyces osmophilus]|uniref:L-ornithine N(5)-monooxygenase [NAD(P)H] n=1 Tax=Schizosaccharomyces osmophilus TaxID=2545709 RepID=A0AAE9WA30_9SCHI|nr:ornithine N5 monooxygenase [Schizosaccharomyces osmophilus]WBW72375.1 ornithine N5 monooxygenase [Schizosaccharomyces osmophilus]